MKRRHELRKSNGVWTCDVCRWEWQGRPRSRCPGVPRHTWETAAAAGLATKTTLGREGLKPANGQLPAGAVLSGDNLRYWRLYERAAAVPKREMTPAQRRTALANLEKARQALTCIDCGQRCITKWDLDAAGRCDDCAHVVHVTQRGQEARAELQALATAGDWLIVDFETTGLDGDAEIIQIGIVDPAGAVVFDQLVQPAGPIGATVVHGITSADVAGAPTFPEVYVDLVATVDGRRLLAYNVDFDCRMLAQTCERYALPLPAVEGWTCIMRLVSAYRGEWSNYYRDFLFVPLASACRQMDVETAGFQAHSAAGDAILTWRLLQQLQRDMQGNSG